MRVCALCQEHGALRYHDALATGDMRVAGLHGTCQQNRNGTYKLHSSMWTCGRPVYKKAGADAYLFRATSGRWFISDKEAAAAGKSAGWVKAKTADNDAAHTTPDQVTGGWQYTDGTGTWTDAPEVGFCGLLRYLCCPYRRTANARPRACLCCARFPRGYEHDACARMVPNMDVKRKA